MTTTHGHGHGINSIGGSPATVPTADAAAKIDEAKAAIAKTKTKKKKKHLRSAAGKIWRDDTLADWPDNDFRIFCGDLGNEVNDNSLSKLFNKYNSFSKARVIRDKKTSKTKGYGFVSFMDPYDCATAIREMNGKYVGNRPIKLRKSAWERRDVQPKKSKKKNKFHVPM